MDMGSAFAVAFQFSRMIPFMNWLHSVLPKGTKTNLVVVSW